MSTGIIGKISNGHSENLHHSSFYAGAEPGPNLDSCPPPTVRRWFCQPDAGPDQRHLPVPLEMIRQQGVIEPGALIHGNHYQHHRKIVQTILRLGGNERECAWCPFINAAMLSNRCDSALAKIKVG